MNDEGEAKPYWSIDIPGLTREQGERIVRWAGQTEPGIPGAYLVDPAIALTLHMDRETVESLGEALAIHDHDGLRGLREVIDEWLGC